MLARGPHGVLLRVAPTIPRALDRVIDQVEPLHVRGAVRWRREREHLPHPVIADQGHDRLAARPAVMSIGPRVIRVGGHQSLLNGEHQIVCRVKRRGRHRRIAPADAELKRVDRFA